MNAAPLTPGSARTCSSTCVSRTAALRGELVFRPRQRRPAPSARCSGRKPGSVRVDAVQRARAAGRPRRAARPTPRPRRRRAPTACARRAALRRARPRAARRSRRRRRAQRRQHAERRCPSPASAQPRPRAPADPPRACPAVGMRHRDEPGQQRHRATATSDAERAAGEATQQALGHQLPDEPLASGAERRAQFQLAPPARTTAREQVREVGAGDQQHRERRRRTAPAASSRARSEVLLAQVRRRLRSIFAFTSGYAAPAAPRSPPGRRVPVPAITPGFRRPTTLNQLLSRSSLSRSTAGINVQNAQPPRVGKLNACRHHADDRRAACRRAAPSVRATLAVAAERRSHRP